jgi:DNA-binding MarR family transcriptional regulator
MSSKKDRESIENLDKVYNIVQQSSVKGGINAITIGEKLGMHRTTVHNHLNSLELMGKVESQHGLWVAKTGEQTIKPIEKEIIIELPMPKDKWADIARLQVHADYLESLGWNETAQIEKTLIEQFNQTRRIRIIGRNVEDIDMEKVGNLILQASEKSSKVSFKRFLKNFKLPQLSTEGKSSTEILAKESQTDDKKTEKTVK